MSTTLLQADLIAGVGVFPPVSEEDVLRLLPSDYSADEYDDADVSPWIAVAYERVKEDFLLRNLGDIDSYTGDDLPRVEALQSFYTMYLLYQLNTLPIDGDSDYGKMAGWYLQLYTDWFSRFLITLPSGKTVPVAKSVRVYRGG